MTTEESNGFAELGLQPTLLQAVVERGYQTPTPIQAALIPVMLTGQDVVGQAQTGTGKTAAFALPMLQNLTEERSHIQGLVLTPTRELALQVAEAIMAYGSYTRVRVLTVYGGQAYGPQIGGLRRGADIVVGTPGRLIDLLNKGVLDISQVRTVVLDEADEMLSMGFQEDMETILSATPDTRQTTLFSATLPPEIRRLAGRYLKNAQSITIRREQVTAEEIEHHYYLVNESDRTAALTRLFEIEEITSALIFVKTKVASGELANELTGRGFPAEALNGDLTQDTREGILSRFRQNRITVLVATDVAARGLDIEDISHVFNYDLPSDPEIYVHRVGRTGRAGRKGLAISLVTPQQKRYLRQIEAFTHQQLERHSLPSEEEIRARRELTLLRQVDVWLQRGRCRRERELVEELAAKGHDPLEIAAVALKIARAEEKQRPIAPVTEVVEAPRRERPARDPAYGNRSRMPGLRSIRHQESPRNEGRVGRTELRSHEAGMVRLSLNLGRRHGIRPSDIVGAIAFHADIPGHTIGKIVLQDELTLVDVPEVSVEQVLVRAKEVRIRRMPGQIQRA